MHSLSWFIYWCGVVGNLRGMWAGCIGAAIIVGGVACFVGMMVVDGGAPPMFWSWWRRVVVACVVLLSLSAFGQVFTPSTNTMYAMAAAQGGEQVVQSEAVQGIASDATRAVQQWIKRQLDPPKEQSK